MLFTNLSFWLCLSIYLFSIICIKNKQAIKIVTLVFSYAFYASFEIWFCIPLLLSTAFDFYIGKKFNDGAINKKSWVTLSVVSNLSLLAFFKYLTQFFPENSFLAVFPIGISFYTFQSMSYVIDIYRGKLRPSDSFVDFALYVSFFPQLLAGPIERAHSLLPQIQRGIAVCYDRYREAFGLILVGLFKKVFIGDKLGWLIQHSFNQNTTDPLTLLMGGIVVTCKVYADFSGYSDVARGIAKFLGVELTINFTPFYTAKNPSDFWNKWHRSLSFWVRDYLFNVIRPHGNKRFKMLIALWISFVIIGIWHGNTWNWLAFGIFHGTVMVIYHFVLKDLSKKFLMVRLFWPVGMVAIYFFSGLFHEVTSYSQFMGHIEKMTHLNLLGQDGTNYFISFFILIIPLLLADWYWINNEKLSQRGRGLIQGIIWACFLFLILNSNLGEEPYVYFQF